MQLTDLLDVLRDEFEHAAADVDDRLAAWLGDEPANAPVHCEGLVDTLNRLATVVRLVGLHGQATALDILRDAAQILALSDEATMAEGIPWLMMWRDPMATAIHNPASAESAQIVVDYLGAGPMPPPPDLSAELFELLLLPPKLDEEDEAALAARFTAPKPEDVSLAVPGEVDPSLFESFLADAPAQLARLAQDVHLLVNSSRHDGLPVPAARLEEAQRMAHTFKGSGNIIGIRGVGNLAHRIEDLIDFAMRQGGVLPAAMARDLELATATLDQMVYALRGEEQAPALALDHLTRLVDWARAIDDGSWAELVEIDADTLAGLMAPAPAPAPAPLAVADLAPTPVALATQPMQGPAVLRAAAPSPALAPVAARLPVDPAPEAVATADAGAAAEPEAQVRVATARLDKLVRQAGQALVQHSRQAERLLQVEQRLAAAQASHELLMQRLRQLETQLERQGVSLTEKADVAAKVGSNFDPLELDRYNELHTLAHFVHELAADSQEMTLQAREETRLALLAQTEHERNLKASHRQLLGARLVPFRNIAARLRRNVLQTASATGKQARLSLDGEAVMLDSDVLERLTEPLLHLLRNAVDHGIESPSEREMLGKPPEGTVHLQVRAEGPLVRLQCSDDGRGLDLDAICRKGQSLGLIPTGERPNDDALARLILLPGFSTREQVTDVSGRGVGMDVVAQRLRALKGELDIHTEPLRGTRFSLALPSSLGSAHALVVEVAGERFALPVEGVRMGVSASQGTRTHGPDARLLLDDESWPCIPLATLLGLAEKDGVDAIARPAVVLRSGRDERAVLVDRVVESRELILQEPGSLLRRLPGVASAALRADGRVLFLLDVGHLVQPRTAIDGAGLQALRQRQRVERRKLLVVDDSLSVRKILGQLLTDAGYAVRTARDGFEALQALDQEPAEAVLTDLEMPNLNGLELTRALRTDARWQELPVLMLTSRATDKHRASALEAGVNAYLTKPYTDEDLLARVRGLLA